LLAPAEPVTRQVFTVSRRGGDRKPAVRVVLDALALAAGAESGYHERRVSKEKMSSLPALSAGS